MKESSHSISTLHLPLTRTYHYSSAVKTIPVSMCACMTSARGAGTSWGACQWQSSHWCWAWWPTAATWSRHLAMGSGKCCQEFFILHIINPFHKRRNDHFRKKFSCLFKVIAFQYLQFQFCNNTASGSCLPVARWRRFCSFPRGFTTSASSPSVQASVSCLLTSLWPWRGSGEDQTETSINVTWGNYSDHNS